MNIKDSKIFVTGGAGFIGSHIVESLVGRGANVKVYDNFSSGTLDNLETVSSNVEIVRGDILNYESLEREMNGYNIVSHQAAQLEITKCISDPVNDLESNTVGTLNVLNCAVKNNVEKILYASSACVYGQAEYVPEDEKHPTNPNWAYGISKLAAEKYSQLYGRMYNIPVVCLRYAIIYGPREWYGRVLTIFLKRILDGEPPVVFGDGSQKRDFTYVEDLVKLHNLCIENENANNQVFNISTGLATSINELAYLVIEATGAGVKPAFEQVGVGERSRIVEGNRMRLPMELEKMVLDPSKARKELMWNPEVELKEGIKKEWEWLRANAHRWKIMSY